MLAFLFINVALSELWPVAPCNARRCPPYG